MTAPGRVLLASLMVVVASCSVSDVNASDEVDAVRVLKSERRLELLRGDEIVASFRIRLGANPEGHKQEEGDGRTPEGRYVLDYKNDKSKFFQSIHVSYPDARDRANAKDTGTDPGGDIMVHGQKNGLGWLAPVAQRFDWTDGCIALSDADMQRDLVSVPTPIEILPQAR